MTDLAEVQVWWYPGLGVLWYLWNCREFRRRGHCWKWWSLRKRRNWECKMSLNPETGGMGTLMGCRCRNRIRRDENQDHLGSPHTHHMIRIWNTPKTPRPYQSHTLVLITWSSHPRFTIPPPLIAKSQYTPPGTHGPERQLHPSTLRLAIIDEHSTASSWFEKPFDGPADLTFGGGNNRGAENAHFQTPYVSLLL
jgi:hypothetical protein